MKAIIFFVKFLLIGALFIVSNENLYLNYPADRAQFFRFFYDWLGSLFSQVLQISGYVTNSEWLPENESFG